MTLSHDDIFTTLKNQRRRLVIEYLRTINNPASVRELSRAVAAKENDVLVGELDYKQRKRVYTGLRQTHLPKLAAVGVVRYDADRGTVALTDRISDIEVYLDIVPAHELPWHYYYLLLGGIGLLVGLFVQAGLFPFTLVSTPGYLVGFGLVLVISACAHAYHATMD